MTAHKMAHKMAHKNPRALRPGDGRRRRHGPWQERSGPRTVGQDWFCPVPVTVADRLWGGPGW